MTVFRGKWDMEIYLPSCAPKGLSGLKILQKKTSQNNNHSLGILAHRTSNDDMIGVYKHLRNGFGKQVPCQTILSFGVHGSLGIVFGVQYQCPKEPFSSIQPSFFCTPYLQLRCLNSTKQSFASWPNMSSRISMLRSIVDKLHLDTPGCIQRSGKNSWGTYKL